MVLVVSGRNWLGGLPKNSQKSASGGGRLAVPVTAPKLQFPRAFSGITSLSLQNPKNLAGGCTPSPLQP